MEFIILRTRPILIFSLNVYTIEIIYFLIQNRSQISSSYNEEKSNK